MAKRQRHESFLYRNIALAQSISTRPKAARVCQKLYKCAHRGYKSFKPRQTGRSTGYPVPSDCRYTSAFPFLSDSRFASFSLSLFLSFVSSTKKFPFYMHVSEAVYSYRIVSYGHLQDVSEFSM